MKKTFDYIVILVAALLLTTGCQDSDVYKSLADPVSTFISQYWPNSDIASYTHTKDGNYVVVIKNGPEITFDSNYSWTKIDGCGMPLPAVLLYDRCPGPLFQYLSETENTNSVFVLERTPRYYFVTLLNSKLTYDIATSEVRGE